MVTKSTVADYLKGHLDGVYTTTQVVSWAEGVMQDGEIDTADTEIITDTIARMGLADVAAFGLTWEEIRSMLSRLGYQAKIEVEPST